MAETLEELVFSLKVEGAAQVSAALTAVSGGFSMAEERAASVAVRIGALGTAFSLLSEKVDKLDIGIKLTIPAEPAQGLNSIATALQQVVLETTTAATAVKELNTQLAGLQGDQSKISVKVGGDEDKKGPHQRLEELQKKLKDAQAANKHSSASAKLLDIDSPKPPSPLVKDLQLEIAKTKAEIAEFAGKATGLGRVFAEVQNLGGHLMALGTIVQTVGDALEKMLHKVEEEGNAIMNLRQISGATTSQAAQFTIMANLAGVKPEQISQDASKLSMAVRSQHAEHALGMLGIRGQLTGNSLEQFGKVLDALGKMQNGMRKTRIENDIFGNEGATALQPLLRLSGEQRNAAMDLGVHFDPAVLDTIHEFHAALALLGETLVQRIALPLASKVLPPLTRFVEFLTQAVGWVANLAGAADGFLGYVVVFGLIAAAIATVITALKELAIWEAVVDALSGNWGAIAGAVAVGAAAGVGIWAYDKYHKPDKNLQDINANTAASAKVLEDIHGHLIGGGDRGRRAQAAAEYDVMRRAMAMG